MKRTALLEQQVLGGIPEHNRDEAREALAGTLAYQQAAFADALIALLSPFLRLCERLARALSR